MDPTRRANNPKASRVVELMEEHGLHPLDKPHENLNRFLAFVGKPCDIPRTN